MEIIIDATTLRLYPVGRPGFTGGTEQYLHRVAQGLSQRGHTVHVVTPDLDRMERRGDALFYWPPDTHPTHAECVVAWHSLENVNPMSRYRAPILVCATNGLGADLGPDGAFARDVDAWPCFSVCHADLLAKTVPTVDRAKCHVTGLGIDLEDYGYRDQQHYGWPTAVGDLPKVPGRMLVANDPARGLWHVLDIFEHVRKRVPGATLHVAYDFDQQFEHHRWGSNALAEALWDTRERLVSTEGVRNLGQLSRADLVREQMECQVHCWPSDPPNIGSQIWGGLTQVECAAAGCALVVSDCEAMPEVLGSGALVLPTPGRYLPQLERRYDAQDWAEAVTGLMLDPERWAEASRAARAMAERYTWAAVVERWGTMLGGLEERARADAVPVPEAVA